MNRNKLSHNHGEHHENRSQSVEAEQIGIMVKLTLIGRGHAHNQCLQRPVGINTGNHRQQGRKRERLRRTLCLLREIDGKHTDEQRRHKACRNDIRSHKVHHDVTGGMSRRRDDGTILERRFRRIADAGKADTGNGRKKSILQYK